MCKANTLPIYSHQHSHSRFYKNGRLQAEIHCFFAEDIAIYNYIKDKTLDCKIIKIISAKSYSCSVDHFSPVIFRMSWPGYIYLCIRLLRGTMVMLHLILSKTKIKNNFWIPLLIFSLCEKYLPQQTLLTFSLDTARGTHFMNINKCIAWRWEDIKLFPSIWQLTKC